MLERGFLLTLEHLRKDQQKSVGRLKKRLSEPQNFVNKLLANLGVKVPGVIDDTSCTFRGVLLSTREDAVALSLKSLETKYL